MCGGIIPLPMYPLSAIHPEGSRPSSSPEGAWCGHVVHGAGVGVGGPHEPAAGQDQDQRRSCRSSCACPTTIRGERANSSRGRGGRPARQSQPSGTSSAVSSLSFRARTIAPVMTPDGPRDSGLGHTQLLADHRLHNVVTHVDQRRPQRPPQPQARRIPLDTLLAQTDEQIRELGRGQSRGILHDDGPFLVRSSVLVSVDYYTS